MKYLFQFALIAAFSLTGELLRALLPFPIPGSVYGMVLLLILLCLKVVKLEWVEGAAEYLVSILPALFVPALVSVTQYFDLVAGRLPAILIICISITFAVIFATGHTAQLIRRKGGRHRE